MVRHLTARTRPEGRTRKQYGRAIDLCWTHGNYPPKIWNCSCGFVAVSGKYNCIGANLTGCVEGQQDKKSLIL